jgi:hypothetical protein
MTLSNAHQAPTRAANRLTLLRRLGPFAILAVAFAAVPPASALEPEPGEEKAIKACEQRLCTMVLGRKPEGADLSCDVAKTWDRDTLKKGESSSVSWGFGDARCQIDLNVSRADVIGALTKPSHTIDIPEHQVQCVVERDGKPSPVVAKLAPKLVFKKGKADKIWINLKDIDGPKAITSTVWMAAELEDKLGLFHGSMLKSVNKFLHKRCDQRYFADGRPKPDPKEEKKKLAKADKTKPKGEEETGSLGDEATEPPPTKARADKPAATPAPRSADAK